MFWCVLLLIVKCIISGKDNYHWAPYADPIGLCGSIKYDLIGQLETAHQHIDEMKQMVTILIIDPLFLI